MTDAEISSIEAAAKAATRGPWHNPGRCFVVARYAEDQPIVCDCLSNKFAQAPKDAKYIAAANPAAILELIAELRQTRAERDWLVQSFHMIDCPPHAKDVELCNAQNKCPVCWRLAAKEAVCQMQ